MKILGIVGSKRKTGNTYNLVRSVLEGAEKEGADTELVFISDYSLHGCSGCEGCSDSFECVIEDDMPDLYSLIQNAEGIVLGSPAYWYNVTSDMKVFIDRCYSLIKYPDKERKFWVSAFEGQRKQGVPVAVCEQEEDEMMGFTPDALELTLEDLDIQIADRVIAKGFFGPGEVKADPEIIEKAERAGRELVTSIRLNNETENSN